MIDLVRDYLRSRNYADFVVRDGLEGLVRSWERTVESVVSGQEQYQDDYLNDMDGRRILEEAFEVAPPEESSRWLGHVRTADERIREHLISTTECIWGEENAADHGYSRERGLVVLPSSSECGAWVALVLVARGRSNKEMNLTKPAQAMELRRLSQGALRTIERRCGEYGRCELNLQLIAVLDRSVNTQRTDP